MSPTLALWIGITIGALTRTITHTISAWASRRITHMVAEALDSVEGRQWTDNPDWDEELERLEEGRAS